MAFPPADEEAATATDETTSLVPRSARANSEAQVRLTAIKRRIQRHSPRTSTVVATVLTLAFASTLLTFIIAARHNRLPRDDGTSPLDHLTIAHHGAVNSDVATCSEIGVSMLRDHNGTAVDAAIATALCIGVVNMYASGIGGGGFMVIRAPDGRSLSVNFRETAPGAATRDMFTHDPLLARRGGLAVGTPGEVAGFYAAWKQYGRVPWRTLFAPSIELCEQGVKVPRYLRHVLDGELDWLAQVDKAQFGFLFRKDGNVLEAGDLMYRPALGRTLRAIAEGGPAAFYTGTVASSLARFVRSQGGVLAVGDLRAYTAPVEETLKVWAFGQEILTCPPPCSGAVLIEGLNIAEGLDMSDDDSAVVTHRIIETMKWLSAGRTEIGDPSDDAVSNDARIAELQTKQFAAMVRQNISDTRTYGWEHYHPSYEFKESKGTSHINALDAEGMAVALTTTVNLYFGARICDPETGEYGLGSTCVVALLGKTGVVLNDEMDDFSIPGTDNAFHLQPSRYNFIKPYKRPLSSTAPMITVSNGRPSLIIGGSGGSRIVTNVFLCFIKMYKWGYTLLDTIRSPRVHHQLMPMIAYVEAGTRDDIVQGLEDRGHVVQELPNIGSVVGAVHRLPDGEIHAVSDYWRKGGSARNPGCTSTPWRRFEMATCYPSAGTMDQNRVLRVL
ncbi:Gamma-glutamyltransferase [Orbilia brochopaga]|nr:Gamma-glutamyltransferase [Drechslerella brochopaga]